jgi:hypothetical protein
MWAWLGPWHNDCKMNMAAALPMRAHDVGMSGAVGKMPSFPKFRKV